MQFFHWKVPASFSIECGDFLRFLAVKFFSPHSPHFYYKKETTVHGFKVLTSCMSTASYSTAPFCTYFNAISCESKKKIPQKFTAFNSTRCGRFPVKKVFSPLFTAIFLHYYLTKPRPGRFIQLHHSVGARVVIPLAKSFKVEFQRSSFVIQFFTFQNTIFSIFVTSFSFFHSWHQF